MGAELPSQEDSGPISNINVTPFVDVVLVLLVIFMVTAPMLVKELISIKLPKTATSDGKAVSTLGVAITREGQVLLNGKLTDDATLSTEVQLAVTQNPDTQAILSADQDTRHGDVVRVIDLIKTAGLQRFAVQIERKSNNP